MNINVEKILNGSTRKVLMRAYEALQENYTQVGAMEYFLMYEKLPLSDILVCSRWIFAEPIKGYSFYKNIISECDIPLDELDKEYSKVNAFLSVNGGNMSSEMIQMFEDLKGTIYHKSESLSQCIKLHGLYTVSEETTNAIILAYDSKYRLWQGIDKDHHIDVLRNFAQKTNSPMCLIDTIILLTDVPETHDSLLSCIKRLVINTKEYMEVYEYKKVLARILMDPVVASNVKSIPNARLRFAILEARDFDESEEIQQITTECAYDFDALYSSPENSINKVFEDDFFSDALKDENDQEKLARLEKEKSVVDNELLFMTFDLMTADHDELDKAYNNAVVDYYLGSEISNVEDYPTTLESKMDYLMGKSNMLEEEISSILESNATIEEEDQEVFEFGEPGEASKVIQAETEKKIKDAKPMKKSFANSVQNKALDANVNFKKVVAKGSRSGQEIKNAGKAVLKIPQNVTDKIKGNIKEWDDMDDTKRKEYIIKPGFRKKYFRTLRIALSHYAAYLVNPALNVVLLISGYLSKEKDARIRNELLIELNSEIKICDEKIADANANGETKKKYELMRIKDKLSAEVARVNVNSRYI